MNCLYVVGNAAVDLIQRVARLPRPGETLLSERMERCAGGKGLNQAIAAARTGACVRLIAPIGRDAEGDLLRAAAAREAGLETRFIEGEASDISAIFIAGDGENVIVSSAAAALALTPTAVRQALKEMDENDGLLVQGNLSLATTLSVIDLAAERGAVSVLNAAPLTPAARAAAPLAGILIVNEGEAEALSGHPAREAAGVLRRGKVQLAIVTRGHESALVAGPEGMAEFPVPRADVVDTSGAGDVFLGTFVGLRLQGVELGEAMPIALAAASISVTRPGTTPSFPTRAEIEALRRKPLLPLR